MHDFTLDVDCCPHCLKAHPVRWAWLSGLWENRTHWGVCPETGMALFLDTARQPGVYERFAKAVGVPA